MLRPRLLLAALLFSAVVSVAACSREAARPGDHGPPPVATSGQPDAAASNVEQLRSQPESVVESPSTAEPPPSPPAPPPQPPPPPKVGIPVLMYHEIGEGPNSLYVSPEELAAHLGYLREHDFTSISLHQLYAHLATGADLPPRSVVLTFDDGYESFYTAALPLLMEFNYTASLFLITDAIGEPGYLTWEQVHAAVEAGMEIGAHTRTHPDLPSIPRDAVIAEITESKAILEEALGLSIGFFAYPAGRYDQRALAAVEAAGYLAAVTTAYSPVNHEDDLLRWPRIRITPGAADGRFARQIQSASGLQLASPPESA